MLSPKPEILILSRNTAGLDGSCWATDGPSSAERRREGRIRLSSIFG